MNPNTGMLTILGSFAFGTFFMASATGKELVHLLHPVFRAGWVEPEHELTLPKLNYEGVRKEAMVPSQQLQEMRVTRKNSLRESLYRRGHGISDSHSGRWVENDDKTIDTSSSVDDQQLREMRAARKKSLRDALFKGGRGVSDSHSGRWVEENSQTKFERG